ncbi:MAG: FtsW/RodA/SpoVE family cell cycle protein [Micrococcaceae bacterium]
MEQVKIPTGRNFEAALLIPALATVYLGYFLTEVQYSDDFASWNWLLMAGLAVLAYAMHMVIRMKAPYADPILLPIATLLNGLGLVMIHRIDLANKDTKGWSNAAPRQLMWTIIAVCVASAIIFFLKDYRVLRRYTYVALAISAVLLVSPLLPFIGEEINGARVWVHFGRFSFQPGEIAKITLAIFFAGYLSSNRDLILLAGRKIMGLQLPRFKDMAPMLVIWGSSVAILILQKDLGSALLYFGLFMSMLYIATGRVSWILIGLSLISIAVFFVARTLPHVGDRFVIWRHAFDDDTYNKAFGGSYQIVQGIFGLSSGGLTGTGWGQGRPFIVPFANSDFIITSLGEELGLVGLLAILCLFFLIAMRGFKIAISSRDAFGKLFIAGLSFAFAWQCFIMFGGVTLLIPLTGLTTPFLSAGGSSLIANWTIIGLMLIVSNSVRRPELETTHTEMIRTFDEFQNKREVTT